MDIRVPTCFMCKFRRACQKSSSGRTPGRALQGIRRATGSALQAKVLLRRGRGHSHLTMSAKAAVIRVKPGKSRSMQRDSGGHTQNTQTIAERRCRGWLKFPGSPRALDSLVVERSTRRKVLTKGGAFSQYGSAIRFLEGQT